ncbi:MAG: XdhC family protein [Candidatus Rokubacteria bacterium]|nr:XdhC family protein [Candidatus Rokubacteria bacterium]
MTLDLLALALELARRGEPFALATVVRCERPASARPGARALIREDGTVSGWIGGSCAEPLVVKEALQALHDGEPRLIALVGEGAGGPAGREGVRWYAMPCHSGGTLEIYVEPVLPKPQLVLVGSGPVVETLARLAAALSFAAIIVEREPAGKAFLAGETVVDDLARVPAAPRSFVVVATHGRFDEDALEQALQRDVVYVSLVASPRRAAAVVETLRARGVAEDRLRRLKAPAGLDLGAVTPEEIAVSILAEIVRVRRSAEPGPRSDAPPAPSTVPEARDPVCGMTVEVARARATSEAGGRSFYFCCAGCKERFDRDPAAYAPGLQA